MPNSHATLLPLAAAFCIPIQAPAQSVPDAQGLKPAQLLESAFSCPLDRLRQLYTDLNSSEEVLDLMAVESEILLICRDRQEKLRAIATAEMELRNLLDIVHPGPGAARIAISGTEMAAAPMVMACPQPETGIAVAAAGEQIASGPAEAPPQLQDSQLPDTPPARMASSPVLTVLAALPAADDMARLLALLAERSHTPDNVECGAWRWVWTSRDFSGRPAALLLSPTGEQQQVTLQTRLPGGLTVTDISTQEVVVTATDGTAMALPRAGARPAPPMDDPLPGHDVDGGGATIGQILPPEVLDQLNQLPSRRGSGS